MAVTCKVWDLDQLSVIPLGIPVDGEFGDGEVVTIEFDEADFTVKKGTGGDVVRSKTYNQLAKVTISLLQTAAANALFSAARLIDVKGKNGAGIGPMLIKDRNGGTLYAGTKCWIEGPPKASFGREGSMRDWTFVVADLTSFEGGN